jgi:HEAT repeat protein
VRPRHFTSYCDLLRDRDARVRGAAATSFGLGGDPATVKMLVPLLGDPSHDVRARTATALARIALARGSEDGAVGSADADADVGAGTNAGVVVAAALPKLLEMASGDPVPCVRDAAASALRHLGRQASDAS